MPWDCYTVCPGAVRTVNDMKTHEESDYGPQTEHPTGEDMLLISVARRDVQAVAELIWRTLVVVNSNWHAGDTRLSTWLVGASPSRQSDHEN